MNQAQSPTLFRLNIEVGDVEEAARFYGRLLGQAGRPQMGQRIYFEAGGVMLQVVAVPDPHPLPKALYFSTADLDAIHAEAAALGCLSAEDVHGRPAGQAVVRPWGERSFYADDPWGNPLCFVAADTIYAG
jgi:extradiol dioxygenase family protein